MRTIEKYFNSCEGDATHTVTIKKGQAPYNFVTYNQCETLSNGFATANNYDISKMYTKLCSSYAWDTALKFVGGDYAINSPQSNYKDATFIYKDITGASQTKNNGESTLIPTGQTESVKKIFDMGGNLWEFTSEYWSDPEYPIVFRGGDFYRLIKDYAAGRRSGDLGKAENLSGFRPTLFLK